MQDGGAIQLGHGVLRTVRESDELPPGVGVQLDGVLRVRVLPGFDVEDDAAPTNDADRVQGPGPPVGAVVDGRLRRFPNGLVLRFELVERVHRRPEGDRHDRRLGPQDVRFDRPVNQAAGVGGVIPFREPCLGEELPRPRLVLLDELLEGTGLRGFNGGVGGDVRRPSDEGFLRDAFEDGGDGLEFLTVPRVRPVPPPVRSAVRRPAHARRSWR